ncbi:unnamed protein product [Owenia fusiformis]|uniref:Uncharacterized protein n=1 Tax=Owenia fusiformis TaxID=6347 RepID=A0A8J1U0H9_OWEFU|nr:unnamed protein product [Owenia fusiformis]
MAGSNLANRGFLTLVQTYLEGEAQFNARYADVMEMIYHELIDKEPYDAYEFSEISVREFTKAFLDCHVLFLRGRTFEPSVCGRSITGNARVTYWTAFNSVHRVATMLLPVGHRVSEIQDVLDRYHNKGPSSKNALIKNRSLFASDMMAHQRLAFMASVRMHSSRTTRPETWIGRRTMNENGYYLGDGMTTIMKDGDELGIRGNELFQHYDWAKIPGATIEYAKQVPRAGMEYDPTNFPHHISKADFVGSTSDGVYGVAAMIYDRPTVNITLKKSWFFFDDELICLGSNIETREGINDTQPVLTTLNQIIQDGAITAYDETKGLVEIQNGEVYLPNPTWVHHDNTGYIFLSNVTNVYMQGENRSNTDIDGNKVISNQVFSTWIDHGRAPQNLQYAYSVRPNITVGEIDAYINSSPVRRVQQNSNIHAVFHTKLNITGLVFFTPGNVSTPNGYVVSADNPSIVMIRESKNNMFITCSNPENKGIVLKIKLSKNVRGPGARFFVESGMTDVTFNLPSGRLAGSSITKLLKWQ